MHWCLCNRSSIKILTSKSYEVITPGYINVDGTALYTCILYMYICISSVKIYLLGPVLHVFWPNVLPKLFQVKLHASARQSNLLQPRKQLQFFVWLLWIFSFVGSFKTVIVISKLELWPKLLWSLYSLSIPFFLPTISSLFFSLSPKKKKKLNWTGKPYTGGLPERLIQTLGQLFLATRSGGTVPLFQWSFRIKNTQRRNTSKSCFPFFHDVSDVILFCHSHWPWRKNYHLTHIHDIYRTWELSASARSWAWSWMHIGMWLFMFTRWRCDSNKLGFSWSNLLVLPNLKTR